MEKNSVNRALEQQLKDSFLQIKILKQENKHLASTYDESKVYQDEVKKLQNIVNELEQKVIYLEEVNYKLEQEVGYLRGFQQSKEISVTQKPSYQQMEQELTDLQSYLRKFILLQDSLIEQIPNINLQGCWKEINQMFKNEFNTNQSISNIQEELRLIEVNFKEMVHQKEQNLSPLQEMAKQQTIRELRVEIERLRKEVQLKQIDLKQYESKLVQLLDEFKYLSKIETRKNNVQLEAEKQLIDFRKGISTTKNSNHQNYFSSCNADMIPQREDQYRMSAASPFISTNRQCRQDLSEVQDFEEKTPIERTIDITRKKLSRQFSQASSLRDYKYI